MKKIFTLVFILPGIVALFIGLALSMKDGGAPTFPPAIETPVVTLRDGETYAMTASYVTKDINGIPQTMLAYNGSIPGPTIRVKEGETIFIRLTNNTGMETLLHPHGVRVENAYDGTHLVQDHMKSGETFTYKLTFPDPGVFWYHPHVREDLQQDLGLAGNFIVSPKDETFWPKVDREEVVMLDGILLEEGMIAPHSQQFATHVLMGRFGNTILANGSPELSLSASTSEVVRYYFTNAANTRTFALTMNGAKMKLVGGDNGRYEKEELVSRIILAPSERAVVDVLYELPKVHTFVSDPGDGNPVRPLFSVNVRQNISGGSKATSEFMTLRSKDAYADALAEYRSYLPDEPIKTLVLTLDTNMQEIMQTMMNNGVMMGGDGHAHDHGSAAGSSGGMGMMHPPVPIEWEDAMGAMNIFSTDKNTRWILRDMTGVDTSTPSPAVLPKDNADVHWRFEQGDLVKIRLFNDPKSMHPMHHPFHLHGQRFLVLSRDGAENTNLVWKDSVLVKMGETVDILVPMEHVGKWMAHCHIAEHLTSGMMILFDVEEKKLP